MPVSNPSSSFDFDRATYVEKIEDRQGTVTFSGHVHDGWDIMGNANGGYLMALAGHALSQATDRPDCLTLTAHFLAPCPAGDVRISVTPIRSGRRFATARAEMWITSENRPKQILQVVATMADLATDPGGPTAVRHTMPALSPWVDCPLLSGTSVSDFAHLHGRLATRGEPEDLDFRNGRPSGTGRMRGWFAFADGREVDTRALLLASDAFPPAVFNLDVGTSWVPTVEMTVHTRARPSAGPVACFFTTRYLQDGLLEEDGEMWDSSGRLVAQSRQLALAPRAD